MKNKCAYKEGWNGQGNAYNLTNISACLKLKCFVHKGFIPFFSFDSNPIFNAVVLSFHWKLVQFETTLTIVG